MAAPHIAGIAALYLQAHPSAGPYEVSTVVAWPTASHKSVCPESIQRCLCCAEIGKPQSSISMAAMASHVQLQSSLKAHASTAQTVWRLQVHS